MRIIVRIGSFIGGLIIATSIYAQPQPVNGNPAAMQDLTDTVASQPQQLPPAVENPLQTATPTPTPTAPSVESAPMPPSSMMPSSGMPQQESQPPIPTTSITNETLAQPSASITQEITEPVLKNFNDRLVVLETQHAALHAQLVQMEERINSLNAKLGSGEQKMPEVINRLKNYLGPQLFMVVSTVVIIVFLLLLVYIITPKRKKSVAVSYPQGEYSEKEQEFDLMKGAEGVEAKLNLARAYIEMGQGSKAQGILNDVLLHGNDNEQKEAKTLLDKIKNPVG